MKNILVYDSQFGNTKKIGEEIATVVHAKVIPVQLWHNDFLKDMKLLIIGCPIHGWRPSEATTAFLAELSPRSLEGIWVAAFGTRVKTFFSGDAVQTVLKKIEQLGGQVVAEPGKFYVSRTEGPLVFGEIERARQWATQILITIKKSELLQSGRAYFRGDN